MSAVGRKSLKARQEAHVRAAMPRTPPKRQSGARSMSEMHAARRADTPLPDHMLRKMLEDAVWWRDRLRQEAIRRGAPHTSVTSISDVILWLRSTLGEP